MQHAIELPGRPFVVVLWFYRLVHNLRVFDLLCLCDLGQRRVGLGGGRRRCDLLRRRGGGVSCRSDLIRLWGRQVFGKGLGTRRDLRGLLSRLMRRGELGGILVCLSFGGVELTWLLGVLRTCISRTHDSEIRVSDSCWLRNVYHEYSSFSCNLQSSCTIPVLY